MKNIKLNMNNYSIDIWFTNKCDFDCPVCINRKLKKDDMDSDNMEKVLFFLKNNAPYFDIISFNGIWNIFLHKEYVSIFNFLLQNVDLFHKKIYLATKFRKVDFYVLQEIYKEWILNNISIWLYNFETLKKIKGFSLMALLNSIKKYRHVLPLSMEVAWVYGKKEFVYWKKIWNILWIDVCFERLYDWWWEISYYKNNKDFILNFKWKHCYNNFFIYIDVYWDFYPCVQYSNKWREYSIWNIKDLYLFNMPNIELKMQERFSWKICKTCSLRKDCNIYNNHTIKKW